MESIKILQDSAVRGPSTGKRYRARSRSQLRCRLLHAGRDRCRGQGQGVRRSL